MDVSAFIPIATAIVGAGAALLAGDLLTAKARLRRKLDREVTILDRMPKTGKPRQDMHELVRRHALELYWRERIGTLKPFIPVVLGGVVVGLTILGMLVPSLVEGTFLYVDTTTTSGRVFSVLFLIGPLGLFITSWSFVAQARRERLAYVDEWSARPEPRPMPLRTVRGRPEPTPEPEPSPAATPTTRGWWRRQAPEV